MTPELVPNISFRERTNFIFGWSTGDIFCFREIWHYNILLKTVDKYQYSCRWRLMRPVSFQIFLLLSSGSFWILWFILCYSNWFYMYIKMIQHSFGPSHTGLNWIVITRLTACCLPKYIEYNINYLNNWYTCF